MLELDDSTKESNFEKPTAQYMAAIISRTEIINDELSPTDGFEMAKVQIPYIAKMQNKGKSLMKALTKSGHKYELTKIERTALLTLNGKIFIPTVIRNPVIDWYHQFLCHPGAMRTEETIRNTMAWPGLTWNIQSHCKTCKLCQFNLKKKEKGTVNCL
jgi:hypothetical protein